MDIVFESYTANDAEIEARLATTAQWSEAATAVRVSLGLAAYFEASQSGDMVARSALPEPGVFFAATADGIFRASLRPEVGFAGEMPLPSVSAFYGNASLTSYFTGNQINDGAFYGNIPDTGVMSDATALIHGAVPLTTYFSDGYTGSDRIAVLIQQPSIVASLSAGRTLHLADGLAMAGNYHTDIIHALFDLIRASDHYTHMAQVLQALADGVGLADVAQMIIQADLLDSFVASGVQAGMAQVTVFLRDGFAAGDDSSALSEVLQALRDGFYATVTVNTGEDTWTAWVMTPETKAMRSYSNWPFNSYCELGGQYLAAGPAGIYTLGGTTDAGDAIRSAIRTGLLNFGSLAMKGAPLVYIGATTAGNLLLRVQATTIRGEDLEQTYRMTPAVTGKPREHRVPVGRGFRSVYWQFELCNDTDGAAFQVHEWHAVPVTHTGKLI